MLDGLTRTVVCTMVSKMKITKMLVFQVARDFVGLPFNKKYQIGSHFLELTGDDLYLEESDLERKVWEEANKNLANFSHFTELVESYSEVAS